MVGGGALPPLQGCCPQLFTASATSNHAGGDHGGSRGNVLSVFPGLALLVRPAATRVSGRGGEGRRNLFFRSPFCPLCTQGQCAKVASINDKSDWKVVRRALSVINFSDSEVEVRGLALPPCPPPSGERSLS